jgi:undecaprenyl-diphosphatase
MTALKAVLLGLIQGIAEFLPISSSGHLALTKTLFGLEEVPVLFDVILHLATLLSVLLVMRKRIAAILIALWRFVFVRHEGRTISKDNAERQNLAFVLPILIATFVTAALGFAIQAFIPEGSSKAVAFRMIITAAILASTRFFKPGLHTPMTMGPVRAVFIGLAQGIGVLSGISRSGITISAGLFSGLDRETAGEFSFLLSIPAILGAFVLTVKDAGDMLVAVSWGQLALSFVVAFAAGAISLSLLLKVIKGGKIYMFAPYLLIVGILGLIFG